MQETIYKQLSIKVLGMAFTIHNILGPGLLEHAYEEAFCIELRRAGIPTDRDVLVSRGALMRELRLINLILFEQRFYFLFTPRRFERQKVFALFYKGEPIGGYIADLVVENKIVLELKSVAALNPVMEAQLINYLRLSKCPVGYLINFNGLKVEWKRFVYQRSRE